MKKETNSKQTHSSLQYLPVSLAPHIGEVDPYLNPCLSAPISGRSARTPIHVSRPTFWEGWPYLNPCLLAPILGRSALTSVHVSRPKSRGGRPVPQSMSRGTHLGDVDPSRLMQEARLPQHTISIPSSSLQHEGGWLLQPAHAQY